MDVTNILLKTLESNPVERNQAETQLSNARESNLAMFLGALVTELADESKPNQSRQAAGLQLKNTFVSKDPKKKENLSNKWIQQDENTKNQIKMKLLDTLTSNNENVRRVTTLVLSVIASIQIRAGNWVDVIDTLLDNISKNNVETLTEASLTTVGYICEEINMTEKTSSHKGGLLILQQKSNQILTAVVQCMQNKQQNETIRYAATQALFNSLEFIKQNFEKDNERDFIMKTICETTLSQSEQVRQSALECLVKISYLYYDHLKPYMPAISGITSKAIQGTSEDVALQGIEFWSTIAEVEFDLEEKIAELQEEDDTESLSQIQCHHFIKSNIQPITQMLCICLLQQHEDQTDEDWNKASAAATSLSLLAKLVRDDIIGTVMGFIGQNLNDASNWNKREAATLCFSAILDGPTDSHKMSTLISEALPIMLQHIKDEMILVRDTTIFTVGRIAKFFPECLTSEKFINPVATALLIALEDESRVASKSAWAIHNIACHFEQDNDEDAPSNALSNYFKDIIQSLIKCSQREDANEDNLELNVYGAITSLVNAAAKDTYQYLINIMQYVVEKLNQSVSAQKAQNNVQQQHNERIIQMQGLLTGVLQALTTKFMLIGQTKFLEQHSDSLMQLYLSMLTTNNVSVNEEVLLGISSLATALEEKFLKYMEAFKPFLLNGLKNKEEQSVCTVSVSVVSDLCTSLQDKISPYTDEIVTILLHNLSDNDIGKEIKPAIISSFGDIALAIGGNFEKYLKYVAIVLKQAAESKVDSNDERMVEYLNLLRENIFEAFTGILQGLKEEKPNAFDPHVPTLVAFLKVVAEDEGKTVDEIVFKSAVNVIGDLTNVYGSKIVDLFKQPFISSMVEEALHSSDKETAETGKWVQSQIQKILSQS